MYKKDNLKIGPLQGEKKKFATAALHHLILSNWFSINLKYIFTTSKGRNKIFE
jgi:hypothetical protein